MTSSVIVRPSWLWETTGAAYHNVTQFTAIGSLMITPHSFDCFLPVRAWASRHPAYKVKDNVTPHPDSFDSRPIIGAVYFSSDWWISTMSETRYTKKLNAHVKVLVCLEISHDFGDNDIDFGSNFQPQKYLTKPDWVDSKIECNKILWFSTKVYTWCVDILCMLVLQHPVLWTQNDDGYYIT